LITREAHLPSLANNADLQLPGGVQLHLLIASAGHNEMYTTTVALQIVQAAEADKTIVGMMGWFGNKSTADAIKVLAAAHIPLVSPTASADLLTGISPYFFRVIASNKRQVFVAVEYAEHTLHGTQAALFVDPADAYSQELATDFEQQFVADGNKIVATENYAVGHPEMLHGLLSDALNHNPNLLYFAGYAADAGALMTDLPITGPFAHLQVMGADQLFGHYPSSARAELYRLYFTVFITGSMWEFLGLTSKKPTFFAEYPRDFDPLGQHKGNPFGYTRADDGVMLSYDATLALLAGSKIALASLPAGKKLFSPSALQQALTQITGSQAIQGVSGQISFGSDGNVVNKAIVLVKFDTRGNARIDSVQGSFLLGS